jgi:hypothetical protein
MSGTKSVLSDQILSAPEASLVICGIAVAALIFDDAKAVAFFLQARSRPVRNPTERSRRRVVPAAERGWSCASSAALAQILAVAHQHIEGIELHFVIVLAAVQPVEI